MTRPNPPVPMIVTPNLNVYYVAFLSIMKSKDVGTFLNICTCYLDRINNHSQSTCTTKTLRYGVTGLVDTNSTVCTTAIRSGRQAVRLELSGAHYITKCYITVKLPLLSSKWKDGFTLQYFIESENCRENKRFVNLF